MKVSLRILHLAERLLSGPLFIVLITILSSPLRAQEVTAAINGVVTDPSGAAVAGAKVTAKDLDRGVGYPTTTGTDGTYNLPRLPIGRYELRVENPGFQAAVQSPITLQLNQVAKINFQLKVGNVSETVEVSAAPPILQTETTQLGTVLDARTNVALPLATRNYNQLTLLAPGSVTTDPSEFTGPQSTFSSGRPYINGNREEANNYILDGMDNNQVSENDVGYAPSMDAIQEFNLITQNASAEFGNFMGGTVSVSLKSGTNHFHGVAFEFLRNDVLNANQWSNNFQDIPRSPLRWNEFWRSSRRPHQARKISSSSLPIIRVRGTTSPPAAAASPYSQRPSAQAISQPSAQRDSPTASATILLNNSITHTQAQIPRIASRS